MSPHTEPRTCLTDEQAAAVKAARDVYHAERDAWTSDVQEPFDYARWHGNLRKVVKRVAAAFPEDGAS